MSIKHPKWGQVRVSDQLRLQGIAVSASTVRNIWAREGLETRYKRILRLEEELHGKGIELTEEHILTDNGREYCSRSMIHPCQIFLELNDIVHRRTKGATPMTNGFVERFNRTVLDEFFSEAFRKKLREEAQKKAA